MARNRRYFVQLIAAIAFCALLPSVVVGAEPEIISGTLEDGTNWGVARPASWNGVLIIDLDGAVAPPPASSESPVQPSSTPDPFLEWQLAQGYAVGGTRREPVGYDFPKAVDNLLAVRQHVVARWGAPKHTIVAGVSRGAFVARKALELHPDIFAGALISAGGGAGEVAALRDRLNGVWTLKTLVDPHSPLRLVNIADVQAEQAALAALVKNAMSTPQGRARLSLAASVEQLPLWSVRGQQKPAPSDYHAQLAQMGESFAFANPPSVRAGVEKVAGGNVSWNTDVDYADLLLRSGRTSMVATLYREAGLDLAADLALLASAPRIAADPAAVAKAERLTAYTGRVKEPIVTVDNDDPVDSISGKVAYQQLLEKTAPDLLRMIWVDAPGHTSQPPVDRAVGLALLMRRIDSGAWGDTSLAGLQTIAAALIRDRPALGSSRIFDPGPLGDPLFTWDARNWGTYQGK